MHDRKIPGGTIVIRQLQGGYARISICIEKVKSDIDQSGPVRTLSHYHIGNNRIGPKGSQRPCGQEQNEKSDAILLQRTIPPEKEITRFL